MITCYNLLSFSFVMGSLSHSVICVLCQNERGPWGRGQSHHHLSSQVRSTWNTFPRKLWHLRRKKRQRSQEKEKRRRRMYPAKPVRPSMATPVTQRYCFAEVTFSLCPWVANSVGLCVSKFVYYRLSDGVCWILLYCYIVVNSLYWAAMKNLLIED